MKKIKDERLVLQNLKNVRIAYLIQTLGILGILGYDLITKGVEGMRENPLWLVFMITTVISAYLSMSIGVDHEKKTNESKKSITISLIVITIISATVGVLVSITDGGMLGMITGGIIFLCSLIPVLYIDYLRKKRKAEDIED
ncbi:hypothetical protein [Metabacillus malikii]|uniref:Tellurite resistance protein TehA-like permease n=1 Tax=Metabacillus malikii TaxID=1504265 RepID=A0ABT9ZA24_9BACI|nr:hypothetical protein [Metabacillus malikii]MDQ0229092.1 tellurite resistance protein TehA-like permease [Metabacillus malikii]